MKIAIMQPYFFPYIGYFQLIKECDKFVFFNDVQYIRRGWINRNRIRCHNQEFQFLTVPVLHTKREEIIKNIVIDKSTNWRKRHLATLAQTYGESNESVKLYSELPDCELIQDLAVQSVIKTCDLLKIKTEFVFSDQIETMPIDEEKPARRILEICKSLRATEYINLPGGRSLYSPTVFEKHGIALQFIAVESENKLSILDYVS